MAAPEASPEWLMPWLQTPFYEKKCDKHVHEYLKVYCGVCMREPFCKICWKDKYSQEHQGHHPILRVCKASHRPAIAVQKVRKIYDISYIQPYRINSKDIVYLNPSMNGVGEPTLDIKCEICRRRLKDAPYSFCSIACKDKSMELDTQALAEKSGTDPRGDMQAEKSSDPKSLRKKNRKNIPQRAPLQ